MPRNAPGRTLAAHDRPQPGKAAGRRVRYRSNRDHDLGLWRQVPPGRCRLARDHRPSRQADIRRRAADRGSRGGGGGGPSRRHARSAAARSQAHRGGDQDACDCGTGRRRGGMTGFSGLGLPHLHVANSEVPGLLPCRAAPSAGANLNASKRTIIFRLSTVLLDSKSGRAGRVTAKPTSLLRCQQRATPTIF